LLQCSDAVWLNLVNVELEVATSGVDRYPTVTNDLATVSEELSTSAGSKHYTSDDRLLVTKCEVVVPGRRVSISRDFPDYGQVS
jgi:hypothetical protein